MTNTQNLFELMFSSLYGKKLRFNELLNSRDITDNPLCIDLARYQDIITAVSKNEYKSTLKTNLKRKHRFLLNESFDDDIIVSIKKSLDLMVGLKGNKKIRDKDIPFIPATAEHLNLVKDYINLALYNNVDAFLNLVDQGVEKYLPGINYKSNFTCETYATLSDLIVSFERYIIERDNIERDSKNKDNKDNKDKLFESDDIIRKFLEFRSNNPEITSPVNFLIYKRHENILKSAPINAVIIRLKDFNESLPQKIARYWVDILRTYESAQKNSNYKTYSSENPDNIILSSNGLLRTINLEDLLITDIFGVAILFNKQISKKIEHADFYRGRLKDARAINTRTIEKEGYGRTISKLFDLTNGFIVDYHTTTFLDFLNADFLSKKAHVLYAHRRNIEYIKDSQYGKLYLAIYTAVKEILHDCNVPRLDKQHLSYWRASFQTEKSSILLEKRLNDIYDVIQLNDFEKRIVLTQYTINESKNSNEQFSSIIKSRFSKLREENKLEIKNDLRTLLHDYKIELGKLISITPLDELVDIYSNPPNPYYMKSHVLKLIITAVPLLNVIQSLHKEYNKATKRIDDDTYAIIDSIKKITSITKKVYDFFNNYRSVINNYNTNSEIIPVIDYLFDTVYYLKKQSDFERIKPIQNKYQEAISLFNDALDYVVNDIEQKSKYNKESFSLDFKIKLNERIISLANLFIH